MRVDETRSRLHSVYSRTGSRHHLQCHSHLTKKVFLSRDDDYDEGQHGHFTILGEMDGLPYRNLMDADQLLHELA
jgi:hypothetical protein